MNEPNVTPIRYEETEYQCSLIPVEFVDKAWIEAKPLLEKAIERSNGRWSSQSVRMQVASGQDQLWFMFLGNDKKPIGALVTEFVDYPQSRILSIHFMGGKGLNEWAFVAMSRLESFARECGADGIEATGRLGLWKYLKQDAWDRSFVIYEKRF
jgi:hypothetical protein